jgi:CDGSH-type Zn-finger protein
VRLSTRADNSFGKRVIYKGFGDSEMGELFNGHIVLSVMANKKDNSKISITKNGPYVVSGNLPLNKEIIVVDKEGVPVKWKKGKKYPKCNDCALCRCGKSDNKPYCDGTHAKIKFDGTETASKKPYMRQAGKVTGPNLVLTDATEFCALGRFCEKGKGVWESTRESDNPKCKKDAIQESCDCPSGRLVIWDKKTGKAIEPKFKQSISLVEDPDREVSGPIWVKGGVPIESAEGKKYEIRNRVTLCRCGKSTNKPFCDGSHIEAGFRDDK